VLLKIKDKIKSEVLQEASQQPAIYMSCPLFALRLDVHHNTSDGSEVYELD
jgi:hypothetical protein